jgi:hypothetical protein
MIKIETTKLSSFSPSKVDYDATGVTDHKVNEIVKSKQLNPNEIGSQDDDSETESLQDSDTELFEVELLDLSPNAPKEKLNKSTSESTSEMNDGDFGNTAVVVVDPNESKKWRKRLKRWTVGRLSCGLRAAGVYTPAFLLQMTKCVVKGACSPIATTIVKLSGPKNSKRFRAWTFKGVARDGLVALTLLDRTINSTLCAITAPPEKCRSLLHALKDTGRMVFLEKHQKNNQFGGIPPKKLWVAFVHGRPQYSKIIAGSEEVHLDPASFSTSLSPMDRPALEAKLAIVKTG